MSFTFGSYTSYTFEAENSDSKWNLTVTGNGASTTTSYALYIGGTQSGETQSSSDGTTSFTYSNTGSSSVTAYFQINSTAYGPSSSSEITTAGTTTYTLAANSNTLTLAAGYKYTFNITGTTSLSVTAEEIGSSSSGHTVYVKSSVTPYIWAYKSSTDDTNYNTNKSWPGDEMKAVDGYDGWYYWTTTHSEFTFIISNNGNNQSSNQSVKSTDGNVYINYSTSGGVTTNTDSDQPGKTPATTTTYALLIGGTQSGETQSVADGGTATFTYNNNGTAAVEATFSIGGETYGASSATTLTLPGTTSDIALSTGGSAISLAAGYTYSFSITGTTLSVTATENSTAKAITIYVKSTSCTPYIHAWYKTSATSTDITSTDPAMDDASSEMGTGWYKYEVPSNYTSDVYFLIKTKSDWSGSKSGNIGPISSDVYYIYDGSTGLTVYDPNSLSYAVISGSNTLASATSSSGSASLSYRNDSGSSVAVTFKVGDTSYGVSTSGASISSAGTTTYTLVSGGTNTVTLATGFTYTFTLTASAVTIVAKKIQDQTPITYNKAGYYIFGPKYMQSSETGKFVYKLLRLDDTHYYISLLAGTEGTNWNRNNNDDGSNGHPSADDVNMNGAEFRLAYVSADKATPVVYGPSSSFTLDGTTGNPGSSRTAKDENGNFLFGDTHTFAATGTSNTWKIQNNGGSYDLIVEISDNGTPTSWYYISDPKNIVAYMVGYASGTTDGYLYGSRKNVGQKTDSGETIDDGYNKNFFGSIAFEKDQLFTFIYGNMKFYKNKNNSAEYGQNVAVGSNIAPLKFPNDDGTYTIELNFSRTDYQISAGSNPVRVFILGSAVNGETSDTYTDWTPGNATRLYFDETEQCYKGTISFVKDKQFRFLLDQLDGDTPPVTLDVNVGEDDNTGKTKTPGTHSGDTDYSNYGVYDAESTDGYNMTFNLNSARYILRFYIDLPNGETGFTFDKGAYHYTLESDNSPYAAIYPPHAAVDYGSAITPSVKMVVPEGQNPPTTKYVAYTVDGSDPLYNISDDGSTVSTASPATTIATMASLTDSIFVASYWIEADGTIKYKTSKTGETLTYSGTTTTDAYGNKIIYPVHAVAFAEKHVGTTTTYRAGAIIEAPDTFQIKGGITPGYKAPDYTMTVTPARNPQVNRWVAYVDIVDNASGAKPNVRRSDAHSSANYLRSANTDDIFYTLDGSDPWDPTNENRHLAAETYIGFNGRILTSRRIITFRPADVTWHSGTLKVWLAGTDHSTTGSTYAEVPYDITQSTSEADYAGYTENSSSYPADWHYFARVYLQIPDGEDIYVYARENLKYGDSYSCVNLTTPLPGYNLRNFAEKTTVTTAAGEAAGNWYTFALPYYTTIGNNAFNGIDMYVSSKSHPMTVLEKGVGTQIFRNNFYDNDPRVFLKYSDGVFTDVTPEYQQNNTSYHYNSGTLGVNEISTVYGEIAPASTENYCYVEVPATWTAIQVYDGSTTTTASTTVTAGESVENGGWLYYKLTSTSASPGEITVARYVNSAADAAQQMTFTYQKGAVFSFVSPYLDAEHITYGPRNDTYTTTTPTFANLNINHAAAGDVTYKLGKWDSNPTADASATAYNGSTGVFKLDASTASLSQTVTGLAAGTYTVQAIVGKSGSDAAGASLTLNSGTAVTTDFANAQVTDSGRVDNIGLTGFSNGTWNKLETTATVAEGGSLTINVARTAGTVLLSDVTLLLNANSDGGVWTTVPTSSTVSSYDLSNRKKANAFSFFDRGSNLNAIVFANDSTVIGGDAYHSIPQITGALLEYQCSAAPYNVAAKQSDGSYLVSELKLTDTDGSTENDGYHNDHTFGFDGTYTVNATKATYDRPFNAGIRQTICLPFSLTAAQLQTLGVDSIYEFKNLEINTETHKGQVNFTGYDIKNGSSFSATTAGKPYIVQFGSSAGSLSAVELSNTSLSGSAQKDIGSSTNENDYIQGVFAYQTIGHNTKGQPEYWFYEGGDAKRNGVFVPAAFTTDSWYSDIKPFRAYFHFDPAEMKTSSKGLSFSTDDDTPTAIEAVTLGNNTPDGDVYNLKGQLVRKKGCDTPLERGIYIQNNKKIVVR